MFLWIVNKWFNRVEPVLYRTLTKLAKTKHLNMHLQSHFWTVSELARYKLNKYFKLFSKIYKKLKKFSGTKISGTRLRLRKYYKIFFSMIK